MQIYEWTVYKVVIPTVLVGVVANNTFGKGGVEMGSAERT